MACRPDRRCARSDFLGAAAEHFEQAGDDANAAEFHARAAEHARDALRARRGARPCRAGAGASGHAARAAGRDAASLRWRLLRVREQTLDLRPAAAEQGADIDALERLADSLERRPPARYAAWRRSYRALRMADWTACQSAAQRSMAFAESAGDRALRLHALRHFDRRPKFVFGTGSHRIGRAQNNMAGKRIALKHPIESRIDFLRRNFPGNECAVREIGREKCLSHATNSSGAQHRGDAFHDNLNVNARGGCDFRERFAHKTFDLVFGDRENFRVDRIVVLDR